MFMDPGIRRLSGGPTTNGFRYGHGGTLPSSLLHDLQQEPLTMNPIVSSYIHNPVLSLPPPVTQQMQQLPQVPRPNPMSTLGEDNYHQYSEINCDINLGYIQRMILEEDMEDKGYMHQGDSALVAADKQPLLFSEMLASDDYISSPSPDWRLSDQVESPGDSSGSGGAQYGCPGTLYGSSDVSDDTYSYDNHIICFHSSSSSSYVSDLRHPSHPSAPATLDYPPQASSTPLKSNGNALKSVEESQLTSNSFPEIFHDCQPDWQKQFKKGVEEASKFLPDIKKLVIDLESNAIVHPITHKRNDSKPLQVEKDKNTISAAHFTNNSRGRKNPFHEDEDWEKGRSIKQSAVGSAEDTVDRGLFDEVLLCSAAGTHCKLRESLRNEVSKNAENGASKGGSGGRRSRGKKNTKKEVIDLRTLLIHCAQAVAADDRRSANELLKQIRQHGDKTGDAAQRLALIFADGLEARLAGNGTQIYQCLMAKPESVLDILKAYKLYSAVCPFKTISHYFANTTILNASEKASTLHIIDFGIYFGFQWPCLIHRLSKMYDGNPPKLRITGIELPQPGFRPTERIEETGRRLAEYCEIFNVPFEYHPIATKWESIQAEDLNIKKGEVVVVNCLNRLRNLIDETVVVDSPRNVVLNNIRKMNPNVFILGVINGTYSAPFFVTRFREVLFHYSAFFDMIDTTLPRNKPERMLIEREIFGREMKNVVACEGSERVERPETYKQWQVRIMRAGFKQLPLDPTVVKNSKEKVKSTYHKDFLIDEDNKWLLQGWKGRITYALSTWMPTVGGL